MKYSNFFLNSIGTKVMEGENSFIVTSTFAIISRYSSVETKNLDFTFHEYLEEARKKF